MSDSPGTTSGHKFCSHSTDKWGSWLDKVHLGNVLVLYNQNNAVVCWRFDLRSQFKMSINKYVFLGV